ncbi:MAG: phosphoribosylanthranilate isomerase [Candidatus Marinimicrobia bacterium]|nr:phosphoribosylanthranilate isomerase [Candidatus Neomarinimicrobiota bacterium]
MAPTSPRYVPSERLAKLLDDLPRSPPRVGVFQDAAVDDVRAWLERLPLDIVQLHGRETVADIERLGPARCWKMFSLERAADLEPLMGSPAALVLVDTVRGAVRGGTGQPGDWDLAARAARRRPLVLAGGLRPANVAEAIGRVQPAGVDVSSGIEAAPGRKDHELLRAFCEAVKSAVAGARTS